MSSFEDNFIKISSNLALGTEDLLKLEMFLPKVEDDFKKLFDSQKNKYSKLNPFNVDQFTHFLVLLQRNLFIHGQKEISEKIYFYLRTNFCLDLYPDRELPMHFLLVHPLATVLGRANYGDWFVCYQHVTCGGNPALEYPNIGESCVLYAGAKVLGRTTIGANCTIGAGCIIINEKINDNTVIYSKNGKQFKKDNKKNNREVFFNL